MTAEQDAAASQLLKLQLAKAVKPCNVQLNRLKEEDIVKWTTPKPEPDPYVSKRTMMKQKLSPKRSPLSAAQKLRIEATSENESIDIEASADEGPSDVENFQIHKVNKQF